MMGNAILTGNTKSPAYYIWISSLIAFMVLGGYAHFMSMLLSQEILEFSIRIPWALMVSNYVFLVVSGGVPNLYDVCCTRSRIRGDPPWAALSGPPVACWCEWAGGLYKVAGSGHRQAFPMCPSMVWVFVATGAELS